MDQETIKNCFSRLLIVKIHNDIKMPKNVINEMQLFS